MQEEIPDTYGSPAMSIAMDTIKKKKQALIFTNTKLSAEKTAEDISKKTGLGGPQLSELSEKARKALSRPTKQCERLARCIKGGTAFHHAGLTQKQKELIEDNFRSGAIKVIACTPSLAMGVDLPAFRSVIRDIRRYTNRGLTYIPVLEYLQMAGRAGRPRYDRFGEAIIVSGSESEKEKLIEKYIEGEPEEIFSKLAVEPVLRTYILSLIAGNFVKTKKEILGFFEKTFWAHQYKDMRQLEVKIEKMLKLLEDCEFLQSKGDLFMAADELDDMRYRATKLGKRVAELYIDPLTADHFIDAMRRATGRKRVPFSYLQLISYTRELRPLLRVKMKEYDEIQEELVRNEDILFITEPSAFDPGYDEFLNSIKTALFLDEWIEEKDEEYLLEKYSIRPGEIRAKLELSDWLLYSIHELAKLLVFRDIVREIAKLRLRLKYGVREELLPLLRIRMIGRVRARALFRNGLKGIKELKDAPVEKIAHLIGSRKIAESVKEQLGQKTQKLSSRKRKGQKGLSRT